MDEEKIMSEVNELIANMWKIQMDIIVDTIQVLEMTAKQLALGQSVAALTMLETMIATLKQGAETLKEA